MMWADLGILQMMRAEPLITEFYQGEPFIKAEPARRVLQ